ncbi:hypothetical protein KCU73_g551, partial [Aureobasidium melanogenum]
MSQRKHAMTLRSSKRPLPSEVAAAPATTTIVASGLATPSPGHGTASSNHTNDAATQSDSDEGGANLSEMSPLGNRHLLTIAHLEEVTTRAHCSHTSKQEEEQAEEQEEQLVLEVANGGDAEDANGSDAEDANGSDAEDANGGGAEDANGGGAKDANGGDAKDDQDIVERPWFEEEEEKDRYEDDYDFNHSYVLQ